MTKDNNNNTTMLVDIPDRFIYYYYRELNNKRQGNIPMRLVPFEKLDYTWRHPAQCFWGTQNFPQREKFCSVLFLALVRLFGGRTMPARNNNAPISTGLAGANFTFEVLPKV